MSGPVDKTKYRTPYGQESTIQKNPNSKQTIVTLKTDTKNINSQCQIIAFRWEDDLPRGEDLIKDNSKLSASIPMDISNHLIHSCTFAKNNSAPAGSFAFKLDSTRDWKDILKPGQWCLIFMSNDGTLNLPKRESNNSFPPPPSFPIHAKKLRGICYIDRVAVISSITAHGALDVEYEISGRDFGVVYEETQLWYNWFKAESIRIEAEFVKLNNISEQPEFKITLDNLLELAHDLFFAYHRRVGKGNTKEEQQLTELGTQWLMPAELLNMLNIPYEQNESFYGNITNLYGSGEYTDNDTKLGQTLLTQPLQNPLLYITGNAWSKLKELSIEEFHELFTETDHNGHPKLMFRPIPWGIDTRGYPTLAKKVLPYKKLVEKNRFVDIAALNVLDFDIGEENHSRYNHFLVQLKNSVWFSIPVVGVLNTKASTRGRKFPYPRKGEIKRHGLRLMHANLNTFPYSLAGNQVGKAAAPSDGKPDPILLIELNELFLDYWDVAIFFESGTLTTIGNNDIKIGKVININKDVPYIGNKLFYIEGYTDEFIIEENGSSFWTQSLQLTRGIEKTDLDGLSDFWKRSEKNVIASEITLDLRKN